MIRKLLTIFLLPKVIAYVSRRFGGGRTVPQRRSY
jgi:hypothetical protein